MSVLVFSSTNEWRRILLKGPISLVCRFAAFTLIYIFRQNRRYIRKGDTVDISMGWRRISLGLDAIVSRTFHVCWCATPLRIHDSLSRIRRGFHVCRLLGWLQCTIGKKLGKVIRTVTRCHCSTTACSLMSARLSARLLGRSRCPRCCWILAEPRQFERC